MHLRSKPFDFANRHDICRPTVENLDHHVGLQGSYIHAAAFPGRTRHRGGFSKPPSNIPKLIFEVLVALTFDRADRLLYVCTPLSTVAPYARSRSTAAVLCVTDVRLTNDIACLCSRTQHAPAQSIHTQR